MTTYPHLQLKADGGVVTIRLNRPKVHNAFNDSIDYIAAFVFFGHV